MVCAEGVAEGCLAKVEVDQSNLCTLERHAGSDVHACESLTCSRVERCEHDDCRSALLADHEVEVGSENSVSLVHHVTASLLHDDLAGWLVVPFEDIELAELVFLSCKTWDLRKERRRNMSEISLCLDCVVKDSDEEEECEWETEAKDKGCKQDHHLIWSHRAVRAVRVHDHSCVTYVDQSCKLVLLTLLKEEHIQVLHDLLLTLDGEELELLA